MEDDVEVELELEKQLALAHELFPANFRKVYIYTIYILIFCKCYFISLSPSNLVGRF